MIDKIDPSIALPTVAAWLHNLDPILFWRIRWYGLSYAVAVLIGWWTARAIAKAGWSPLQKEQAGDFIVILAFGMIAGARLGYVMLYQPSLLWSFYSEIPYWGVLAIHQGGMSSHGGMLGIIVAASLFARCNRFDPFHLLDIASFSAPIGFSFGRIANFINGELIGREAPDGLPWAVKFPQEMYDWSAEKIITMMATLPDPSKIDPRWRQWTLSKVIVAIQRGEQQVIEAVEPMLATRHPSQLYAVFLEGWIVFLVLLTAWAKPRKPGIIGALFCVSYAVGRIITEFFRRPDPHIADAEFAWINVTRGQWLSGLLMILGIWSLYYARKRQQQTWGGWRHTNP